MDDNTQAAGQG